MTDTPDRLAEMRKVVANLQGDNAAIARYVWEICTDPRYAEYPHEKHVCEVVEAALVARVDEPEAKTLKCPHCDIKLVICDEAGIEALDSLANDKAKKIAMDSPQVSCQPAEPKSKCFVELLTAAQELMYDSSVVIAMPPEFREHCYQRLVCCGCGGETDEAGNPSRHHGGCKLGRLQDAVHAYIGYGDDDD